MTPRKAAEMQRYRQVAAAPQRRASETWEAIGELVLATLDRSPSIAASDVIAAMNAASAIGRVLVAGGFTDSHPVVLIADPVYLNITTVSGVAATNLDEDLGPVPGGATATEWTIYLPTPDPLGNAVRTAIAGVLNLSADVPPGESMSKSANFGASGMLDLDALARRTQELK
jgi:hypothetical protein